MDFETLIDHVMTNQLSIDEKMALYKMLSNSRKAKIAIEANRYFLLGHGTHMEPGGCFYLAAEKFNCSPDTAKRAYNQMYPRRILKHS